MRLVLPRKQRLPQKHLSKDTACRPDIYRSRVLFPTGHDLGRAIPPRRDVVGQDGVGRHRHHFVVRWVQLCPGQTEIAYLEVAVLIKEQVARLEVAMQDARAVDVLETAQELVQEILVMLVRQPQLLAHHWVQEGRGRGLLVQVHHRQRVRCLGLLICRLLRSCCLCPPAILLLLIRGRGKVVDCAGQLLAGFLYLLL